MPWAQIHPFPAWFIIHYCFKGNLHSSAVFWTILWGSIFPDLPRHLFILWHLFICDDVYFTNWGCNTHFVHNAENWTHAFPICLIALSISYTVYCLVSHQSVSDVLRSCFPRKHTLKNELNNGVVANLHASRLRKHDKRIMTAVTDDNLPSVHEETNLFSPHIQIISVKTYSSISEPKSVDRRHNSFEYRYGHWLSCKNCWCDRQSFWRLTAYFFLSIFIHDLIDFFLHHTNAHEQFLPFSKYVWRAPLSYYEAQYDGNIVGPILCAFTILLIVWVYFHKKRDWKASSMSCYYSWMLILFLVTLWCLLSLSEASCCEPG